MQHNLAAHTVKEIKEKISLNNYTITFIVEHKTNEGSMNIIKMQKWLRQVQFKKFGRVPLFYLWSLDILKLKKVTFQQQSLFTNFF